MHPIIDGTPCNVQGMDLPPGSPPPPREERAIDDYSPYNSRAEFEFAEFIFAEEQMSAAKLDKHLNNLAALYPDSDPPFADHKEMYSVIDATREGDVPWQSFSVSYDGELPDDEAGEVPSWMTAKYDVWFRDPLLAMEQQIGNPDFATEMDFAPKQVFDKGNKRQYTDLMSGNWAWQQAVWYLLSLNKVADIMHQDKIAEDEETHGSMFVPVVLGSDKTTVSVATGNNEYYPLYASIGNVHNNVRRAHRNAVSVIGFLALPKSK